LESVHAGQSFGNRQSHPQSSQSGVFYIYFNLLHRYGFKKFIDDAASAGVDGLLVLRFAAGESGNYEALMRDGRSLRHLSDRAHHPDETHRIDRQRGTGFIYLRLPRGGFTGHATKSPLHGVSNSFIEEII